MIDEKKVRLMTEAEMIKKQGRKDLFNASRFYASDYVTFGMLRGAVGATVAYALVVVLAFLSRADDLLAEIRVSDLFDLALSYIQVYVVMLIAIVIISGFVHYRVYKRSRVRAVRYRQVVKELADIM